MGETKTCTKCKLEKSVENFHRYKDGHQCYCKDCSRTISNKRYDKNKDLIKEQHDKRRENSKKWFQELKSKMSCELCGENHPQCLEFHHTRDKEFNISEGISWGFGKEKILNEISKCQILCANCHRKVHWNSEQV